MEKYINTAKKLISLICENDFNRKANFEDLNHIVITDSNMILKRNNRLISYELSVDLNKYVIKMEVKDYLNSYLCLMNYYNNIGELTTTLNKINFHKIIHNSLEIVKETYYLPLTALIDAKERPNRFDLNKEEG